jgi:uncharacterized protein (DUF1697 family)
MTTHLAFLRAVNVGGHGPIPMAKLRTWLEKCGFTDVRTLLQSGNVVFRDSRATGAALERKLETAAEKELGLITNIFIRTAAEWKQVIAKNPFPTEAKSNPSLLVVVVLKDAPTSTHVNALQAAIAGKGRELVRAGGRHVYITYPDGQGHSKLTLALIEKHLGTRGTARNWNTVQKMAALAAD